MSVKRPMSVKRWVGVVLVLGAFILAGGQTQLTAAAITLDDLATTTSSHLSTAPETFVSNDAGGGILGGTRDVTLDVTAATNAANGVAYDISGGNLSYASGATADGSLNLFYDGAGGGLGSLAGLGSLDLVFTTFDFANSADLPITLTITDGAANSHSVTQNLSGIINSPTVFGFGLGAFSGAGVDLSDVASINIFFDAQEAHDFILGNEGGIIIQEIPEPASLALWGVLGVAGAWYARRRLTKGAAV